MANVMRTALEKEIDVLDKAYEGVIGDVRGDFDEDVQLYEGLDPGDFDKIAAEIGPDATLEYIKEMERKRRSMEE